MRFGPLPVEEAGGAILAHSLRLQGGVLKKGLRLGAAEISALQAAGVAEVVVAVLGKDDLGENEAAAMIALRAKAAGISVSTAHAGRVNLLADGPGVVQVNAALVNAVNTVDPAITLATLPDMARVTQGQLLATIKIIPYAANRDAVAKAATKISGAMRLHRAQKTGVSLVMSEVAGLKPRVLEKGRAAVETRLARLGVSLLETRIVPHRVEDMAAAITASKGALVLLLGASATSDLADTAPEALRQAGGHIRRFGIPVDPGNLLFIGGQNGRAVLGLPGCARALALNGADWVLERLICGLEVDDAMLSGMGVGGLLKEIPTRPEPRRSGGRAGGKIGIILLAAGRSRRMRGRDKLLEPVGAGSLLAHTAKVALASRADSVFVVLPPQAQSRKAALEGLGVIAVEAPDYAEGMGGSLRNAMAEIGADYSAVIVALADMPEITPAHFDALIGAYAPAKQHEICRAESEDGTPGHPVLFGRRFFESLAQSSGDSGGKELVRTSREYVQNVPTIGQGAGLDLDTPEAWEAWRKTTRPDPPLG